MRYLFFDIECSNNYGGIPKMCEFGYCITDEHFHLLLKEDITMSPGKGREARFDFKIKERDPEFDWAYATNFYFTQEEFPFHYQKIKELLCGEDVKVFGFSLANDVHYVGAACKRYGLEELSYDCYDVNTFLMKIMGVKNQQNLKMSFLKYYDVSELYKLEPHYSPDDAYMAMKVLQALVEKEGQTVESLIEEYPSAHYQSVEYMRHLEISQAERKKRMSDPRNKNYQKWQRYAALHKNEETRAHIAITNKAMEQEGLVDQLLKIFKQYGYLPVNGTRDADFVLVADREDAFRLGRRMPRGKKAPHRFVEDFLKDPNDLP